MEPWVYDDNKAWGVKTWGKWSTPSKKEFLYVRKHVDSLNPAQWMFNVPKYINKQRYNKFILIMSSKTHDVGHINKIQFIKYLEEHNEQDIVDIYGYENYHNCINYKGEIPNKEFIQNYKYMLAVENNREHNYATEKLWEPFIANCYTFYDGCPNICEYIDKDSLTPILLERQNYNNVLMLMKDTIESNLWENKLDLILQTKKKIIKNYNMFEIIHSKLVEHHI